MIRSAEEKDAQTLTQISFESKGYWNYPADYFAIWKNELTISPAYIRNNEVFVFEADSKMVGYYSMVELKNDMEVSSIRIDKGFWLEHMFIVPKHIGQGIGRRMFDHLRIACVRKGMEVLKILADPNSKGFYEKMGCHYVREFPSTIINRTTPLLVLQLIQ